MPGPLAPFDDAVVAAVADEHGLAADRLRELLVAHQALFRDRDARTVEDMIYEWRTGLPGDPLVARTDAAVYLDAPAYVWEDLLSWLDLAPGDEAAAALRAVHARQFAADREGTVEGAIVVARE